MNLYEIRLNHFAPKGNQEGIYTYLAAHSDENVYEWIKKSKELKDGRYLFTSWEDKEGDEEESADVFDDDGETIGTESFKERMIRVKGDMYDDYVELYDLYYGETLVGWNMVKEKISDSDINLLQELGIAIEVE